MTFYSFSDSTFTRLHREEVEISFSAIDCALNAKKAIYASTELTTGLRLYETMRECGVVTVKELQQIKGKDWYTANIWDANLKAASEFASRVRINLDGNPIVITPGPFSAPGWTQPEYLAFWEQLIRTRISSAWFNLNWQYSNGCTFEYAVAMDAGVPTFDHEGRALDLRQGAQLVETAIQWLAKNGFDVTKTKLPENLGRLHRAFPPDPVSTGTSASQAATGAGLSTEDSNC
jgi:hypothetical protein